ncbi:MAG: DEAD/DEAH box helicase [Candidatus Nitronauta litoralis]|uniref:DEAD-box ATP-dependent RNA helicase RhpA n=1 Tax=Candidatus Nitronauta litoralis TaxID=2705533 RepID=A0A7T0BZ56_9BACT|nr:MAG: DEAD/DEAH box helicase [Candidatus Nitronauta litoralis]
MTNLATAPDEKGFASLNLITPICKAVQEEQYLTPTPIQLKAIPYLLRGRDMMACAQTGTGKTAAFALPILQRLQKTSRAQHKRGIRALVLTPTRELAVQISENFEIYGRHLNFRHLVVYGGVSLNNQIRSIKRGVDILVATPGRLLDLIRQGHLKLHDVELFVLDEADRMMDMGFLPDVKTIESKLHPDRQSMMFSATLPDEIEKLSRQFLKDPVKIVVDPPSSTVEKIDQRLLYVDRENKSALLESVLQDETIERALVFTRTKHGANKVAKSLSKNRIRAEAFHGNKSQAARTQALEKFRSGRARVLVATDVASRGLDVDGITHVINYELPNEPASYVHRIGRTARAGATGIAISFCDAGERFFLRNIQKEIQKELDVIGGHPFPSRISPVRSGKGKNGGPENKEGAPKRTKRNRSAKSNGWKPSRYKGKKNPGNSNRPSRRKP